MEKTSNRFTVRRLAAVSYTHLDVYKRQEQAFEAMVRQYEKLVYTVCCQLVHDHQLAEDLSQETFCLLYTSRCV